MEMEKEEVFRKLRAQLERAAAEATRMFRKTQGYAKDAPHAMESQHDTSRYEEGKRVEMMGSVASDLQGSLVDVGNVDPEVGYDTAEEGAIVELTSTGQDRIYYLLMPSGGGRFIDYAGETITTVSSDAPNFNSIRGRCVGDEVDLRGKSYEITQIW